MKAWLRALIRWLEGGDWPCPDDGHYCGTCAVGQALERRLAPYGNQAEEDYVARRLIAEATATMPISLLEQWVEQ